MSVFCPLHLTLYLDEKFNLGWFCHFFCSSFSFPPTSACFISCPLRREPPHTNKNGSLSANTLHLLRTSDLRGYWNEGFLWLLWGQGCSWTVKLSNGSHFNVTVVFLLSFFVINFSFSVSLPLFLSLHFFLSSALLLWHTQLSLACIHWANLSNLCNLAHTHTNILHCHVVSFTLFVSV